MLVETRLCPISLCASRISDLDANYHAKHLHPDFEYCTFCRMHIEDEAYNNHVIAHTYSGSVSFGFSYGRCKFCPQTARDDGYCTFHSRSNILYECRICQKEHGTKDVHSPVNPYTYTYTVSEAPFSAPANHSSGSSYNFGNYVNTAINTGTVLSGAVIYNARTT